MPIALACNAQPATFHGGLTISQKTAADSQRPEQARASDRSGRECGVRRRCRRRRRTTPTVRPADRRSRDEAATTDFAPTMPIVSAMPLIATATAATFCSDEFLLPASDHVEQHPDRRRVLHNDGDGHAGFLNRDVIEVVRCGHAQHAQHEALDQIGRGKLDALPSATTDENGQQYEQRERSSGLRQDQRIDGMQRFAAQRQFAGEDGAAEDGRNSPEKCGGGDEEISAQRMRRLIPDCREGSVTASDHGAELRNWSRSSGSKPTMTSSESPTTRTSVGVSLLPCCSSHDVAGFEVDADIALFERDLLGLEEDFISSQEKQPG